MAPPVHGQLYFDPNAKPTYDSETLDVRASHIPIPRDDLTGELWVGGSYTLVGKPLEAR